MKNELVPNMLQNAGGGVKGKLLVGVCPPAPRKGCPTFRDFRKVGTTDDGISRLLSPSSQLSGLHSPRPAHVGLPRSRKNRSMATAAVRAPVPASPGCDACSVIFQRASFP